MKNKLWKFKEKGEQTDIKHLTTELEIHPVLAELLVQRGIRTPKEANAYFEPSISQLHDPFLMRDMEIAVERLKRAVDTGENILVYGDYDVDGTTAVSLVYSFLRKLTPNVRYYIPNRYLEGYGVSVKSIDYASSEGCTLFITLDCGIKAIEKVAYGKEKGIDFIICDHHYTGNGLPDAVAILNPKRPECNYPFKHLSGCGVGFKLIQGYCRKFGISDEEVLCYLDLVAISIASDIVSMTGENRILATLGLKKLNSNPGTGIRAIIQLANLNEKLEAGRLRVDDIVFKIGPRINAAGRIENGAEAVALLTATDEETARSRGQQIDIHNDARKEIDQEMTDEARREIAKDPLFGSRNTTVLYKEGWKKGVIGIVASRLIEEFYKPTVILTDSNGLVSGSARSVEGFDLYKAIDACSDLLENFGGHMFAAGVTLKKENVPLFQERFEKVVTELIREEQKKPIIEIDACIDLKDINAEFFKTLQRFEPFGPDNMQPVFCSRSVSDDGNSGRVGKEKEHLRLKIVQETCPYNAIWAIGFQMGALYDELSLNRYPFDICYTLEENTFRDQCTIQLRIKDIKRIPA